MTLRLTLALVTLLTMACSGQKKVGAPERRAPAGSRCASAADCRLSSHRSATDCCGDPCDRAEPFHKEALAALEAGLARNCKAGTFTCPVADCDRPRNVYPGCVDGRCVAVELPRPSECRSDADCELSCLEPGECCATCSCETPWHKEDLVRHQAWSSEHCASADCPQAKCVAPQKQARCENARCVAK